MKANCEINNYLQDLQTEEPTPSQTLWCCRDCQCCAVLLLNFLLYHTPDPSAALERFREVLENNQKELDRISSTQQ